MKTLSVAFLLIASLGSNPPPPAICPPLQQDAQSFSFGAGPNPPPSVPPNAELAICASVCPGARTTEVAVLLDGLEHFVFECDCHCGDFPPEQGETIVGGRIDTCEEQLDLFQNWKLFCSRATPGAPGPSCLSGGA